MDEQTELPGPGQEPVIRAMMMPRDTNAQGTIFGGVILSLIDQAAGAAAIERARGPVVTLKFDEVVFHEPVFVGDMVAIYCRIAGIGRTSIRIHAEVYATRWSSGERAHVTSAHVAFVAIGPDRRPVPVPPERVGSP